jgi:hypothetical protein
MGALFDEMAPASSDASITAPQPRQASLVGKKSAKMRQAPFAEWRVPPAVAAVPLRGVVELVRAPKRS